MRKVVGWLRDYIRDDLDWATFALVAALLAISIAFNYRFGIEPNVMNGRAWMYVPFYALPFGFAYVVQAGLQKAPAPYLRTRHFWLLFLLAVALFSIRELNVAGWLGFSPFWRAIGNTAIRWITAGIPIYLYWRSQRADGEAFYGFTSRGMELKPYWLMLATMAPLLVVASATHDFQAAYPRAELLAHQEGLNMSNFQYGIFEFFYALDFMFTEFFFRGFATMAFAKLCGADAILPMAAFYVFIHFGKPMGEAISSFFGGLILGVVAYRSGSILGGAIVHVGIALLMEVLAFFSKTWYPR